MSELFLVLGQMPADATPDSHLSSGPWCFGGEEEKFPGWEKNFHFPPEPLADPARLPQAASRAQALCVAAIPEIAAALDNHWQKMPMIYWQTLLAPWAIKVASQIVERLDRIEAMISCWGHLPLQVPLSPKSMDFNFRDEQDFSLRGALGSIFNAWLMSFILRESLPARWKIIPSAPVYPEKKPTRTGGRLNAAAFREIAKKILLALPFPPLKGMSVCQAIKFSRSLLHPCQTRDHSLNMEKAFGMDAGVANFREVFLASLPQSLRDLRHNPAKCRKCGKPRLRVASIAAYEDASYRQGLAYWRASGNRLAYVQHGGNYGQVKVACDVAVVEYAQDIFFTWGWRSHGLTKGNFQPMPYPYLCRINNAWKGGSGKLVFVGTEMALYGYRLDSRPTPMQFISYREAKKVFFETIPEAILSRSLYRPYFPLPGTLADGSWLLERFPGLEICRGPLLPRVLEARLLVLDHHGTTMLEAFVANVPLIMYWQREDWPLTREAGQLLDKLEECGIWHGTPRAAARKVAEIWDNSVAWWGSEPIQRARKEFCASQALVSDDVDYLWTNTLKKI